MIKFKLIFNTIKYLKFIQIYYRIFYFARKLLYKVFKYNYKFNKESNVIKLNLKPSIEGFSIYSNKEFTILNVSKTFTKKIDWNYNNYGKLWTYNLNYFEFLKQKKDKFLINDFIDNISSVKDGLEPFPVSLRTINWIKFLTKYEINDKKINNSLYAQQYILLKNLEYHILGNHLLENGFALLFSAYYFNDIVLYNKAKKIILNELKEQILEDGSHFELSPMYHQIMLFRVLDCINLVKHNNLFNYELLRELESKASNMLGWLKNMSYNNGDIPNFNDSSQNIAPNTHQIMGYANKLGVVISDIKLKNSGYKKFQNNNYECIVDIANIEASYIAGHTHADTFNFELRVNNKEFIVDTGVSTYENNTIRLFERGTRSHNCVEIKNTNSSNIWSSFRVGGRAKIFDILENSNSIQATHNGYKKYGILHSRKWIFNDKTIIIQDSLNKKTNAVFRLHFHPTITEEFIKNSIKTSSMYNLSFYDYAIGFNQTVKAIVLEVMFKKNLETMINI